MSLYSTLQYFNQQYVFVSVSPQTPAEWRTVFFLAAGIYCAGAAFYGLFASGKLQPWAEVPMGYVPQMETAGSKRLGDDEDEEE